mmetsp:Transcript_111305/g.314191  ORF Transcript_111305/g.314191 Transcript_111305/m.314191 type:complete len:538 (+) Transcript_111305:248-1861(+)
MVVDRLAELKLTAERIAANRRRDGVEETTISWKEHVRNLIHRQLNRFLSEVDDAEGTHPTLPGIKRYLKAFVGDRNAARSKMAEFRCIVEKLPQTWSDFQAVMLKDRKLFLQRQLDLEEGSCLEVKSALKLRIDELRDKVLEHETGATRKKREKQDGLEPIEFTWLRIRALAYSEFKAEYDALVFGFYTFRHRMQVELETGIRRRLKIAFPDAAADTLDEVMRYPELANMVMDRRLEGDVDEQGKLKTLEDLFHDLSSMKACIDIKIAQETKELHMVFVQFGDLCEQQGEAMSGIESNIKATIGSIHGTIGQMEHAKVKKRDLAWRKAWMKFLVRVGVSSGCLVVIAQSGFYQDIWGIVSSILKPFFPIGHSMVHLGKTLDPVAALDDLRKEFKKAYGIDVPDVSQALLDDAHALTGYMRSGKDTASDAAQGGSRHRAASRPLLGVHRHSGTAPHARAGGHRKRRSRAQRADGVGAMLSTLTRPAIAGKTPSDLYLAAIARRQQWATLVPEPPQGAHRALPVLASSMNGQSRPRTWE